MQGYRPIGELTEEEKKMIREAAGNPILLDEDCPELSEEALERAVLERKQRNKKYLFA